MIIPKFITDDLIIADLDAMPCFILRKTLDDLDEYPTNFDHIIAFYIYFYDKLHIDKIYKTSIYGDQIRNMYLNILSNERAEKNNGL